PSPLPDIAASARYYRRLILSFYDLWVLTISNTFVWRCPTKTVLVPFFRANVGRRHMDVGVGTGYFPAIAMTASDPDVNKGRKEVMKTTVTPQSLTLVDVNPNCLAFAARRIGRPESTRCIVADALKLSLPNSEDDGEREHFDSISLFYLLHCLPGPAAQKA